MHRILNGKNILVTGGTGSFGSAVVKRLLSDYKPRKVVVLSRDEKKQLDMRNKHLDDELEFIIGDVRDRHTVDRVMKRVDLVFHASALKQVPTCEFFPLEAVRTNVLGSSNVISSAVDHEVERLVVLSTDKAVNPVNAMGMTKALMEKLMVAASRGHNGRTILCGTRYGNVMFTRGSVLPYFLELMRKKKPLTITHEGMTRFMLSLDHSIDLVFYALSNGQNGDIYVKKAPASTVGDIAKAMVELFGHKEGMEVIGIRPGEKMHESLLSREEMFRTEDCGEYYKIMPESPRADYRNYYYKGEKLGEMPDEGYTSANTKLLSLEETKSLIRSIPEITMILERMGR